MVDKDFAKRLNQACDAHPHIPPYGQGRQTWIKERLDVSAEAVRKWMYGESRPRPDKMKMLARLLEADEAWLSLGIKPDLGPKERKARNAAAEGAVNVAVGLVQMNGGNVAFPSDKDPRREFVDFYAILRGSQLSVHVSLAKEVTPGNYSFSVPKEYPELTVFGAVHSHPMSVHFLHMTHSLIDKHRIRRGGFFEIRASKVGNEYLSGQEGWPRIHNFTERL